MSKTNRCGAPTAVDTSMWDFVTTVAWIKRYKLGSDGLVWWLPTLRLLLTRVSVGTVGSGSWEPWFLISGPYKVGDLGTIFILFLIFGPFFSISLQSKQNLPSRSITCPFPV